MNENENLLKAHKVKDELVSTLFSYEGFNRVAIVKNDLDSVDYVVLVLSSLNEIPDVPKEIDGIKIEWSWNFKNPPALKQKEI